MVCLSLRSEVAILYNDRSVLENHHVSAAYRLMVEEDMNIFVNLNKDDWRWKKNIMHSLKLTVITEQTILTVFMDFFFDRELRSLVVEMVMSTDMSCHFQQIKTMKNALTQTDKLELKTQSSWNPNIYPSIWQKHWSYTLLCTYGIYTNLQKYKSDHVNNSWECAVIEG